MKKSAVALSLNLVFLVSLIAGGGTSHAAKLTKNQIESIQTNMQNSKEMSDKSAKLQAKAQENSDIASSNFGKSNLQGFNQAATTFSNAKMKFTDAQKRSYASFGHPLRTCTTEEFRHADR